MQDDTDNAPIDLFAQRLRRNAILSRPKPPTQQRGTNWLDMLDSSIIQMFNQRLPNIREVHRGEISYSTTALDGSACFLVSEQLLKWSPITAAYTNTPPARPQPELTLLVQDRDRQRTENRAGLRLV